MAGAGITFLIQVEDLINRSQPKQMLTGGVHAKATEY